MKLTPLAFGLLIIASCLPTPAAASPSCGGGWFGVGTPWCGFDCSQPKVYVKGYAVNPGGVAGLTVTGACGIANPLTGAWTTVFSVSCSATGPGYALCSNVGANTAYPGALAGRCTVGGTAYGNFTCWSAP